MLDSRQWLLAFGASLLVHGVLFVAWPSFEGARAPGEQGIEIGLGLLGDLGEAEEPAPEVEPEVEEPEPPLEPEPPPEPDPPPEPPPVREPEPPSEPVPAPIPTPVIEASGPASGSPQVAPVESPPARRNPPRLNAPRQRGQAAGASSRSAGGQVGLRRSYAVVLAAHLNRYKSYPIAARRQGREGTVTLRLVVDPSGRATDARIARTAEFPEFDEAAMSMLARAQPLPPFPRGMSDTEIVVMVPVSFELDRSD